MNEYPLRPFPKAVEAVRAALPPDPREVYLVGGAVRDWLMGRPLYDVDLVVPRGALSLARTIANRLGAAFYPLDAERGYGRVVWDAPFGRVFVDVSPYRGKSLVEDLRARDFTVNALAVPLRG
jgi:poly(A) polymerase